MGRFEPMIMHWLALQVVLRGWGFFVPNQYMRSMVVPRRHGKAYETELERDARKAASKLPRRRSRGRK